MSIGELLNNLRLILHKNEKSIKVWLNVNKK